MSGRAGRREAWERRAAPPAASAREYLRRGLPAVYHRRDPLACELVGALEPLLDPVVALLDSLHAHLDPALAPPDVLELLASWLGVESDRTLPLGARRRIAANAARLTRGRGTRAGLELALALSFPGLGLEVTHSGSVTAHPAPPPAAVPDPWLTVRCPGEISPRLREAIDRVVADHLPVHVSYRLEPAPAREDAA